MIFKVKRDSVSSFWRLFFFPDYTLRSFCLCDSYGNRPIYRPNILVDQNFAIMYFSGLPWQNAGTESNQSILKFEFQSLPYEREYIVKWFITLEKHKGVSRSMQGNPFIQWIHMNTCVSVIWNLRINSSDDGCMTRFTWHEAVQAVLFIVGKTPVNCTAALACPCWAKLD